MPPKTLMTFADLAWASWKLSFEAYGVIWLRSMRIMAGGKPAQREAERMVREKLIANLLLLPMLARGGIVQTPERLGKRTLAHYRKPMRANRRRLSR